MSVLPAFFADLPAVVEVVDGVDALTEILGAMRLSGGVFLDAEFTAPWCIASQVGPEDCRAFMPAPAQLIAYHYVVEGCLFLALDGEAPVAACARQLLVLPRNDAHRLGSALDLVPANAEELIEPGGDDGLARIRYGGGGVCTRILCGFLGNDERGDPLVASLPPVVKLDLRDRLTGTWIEGSIRYAARTLADGGAGAPASLARLADLLFAEAIREYVSSLPSDRAGWLGGLRDPYVARALALMHARLTHPWTLEALAREVGLSRSALNERFARHLQVSPMRYLTRRRLQGAAEALRHTQKRVASIAYEVGYESEAAFTRAFKREFGAAPGDYRRTS